VGLGGAGIGNLYRAVCDEEAIGAVHAALEHGLCYIDTAPFYGHGRSEARIGQALKTWRGVKPVLSSKVGRVLDSDATPGDFGFAAPLPFRPRFDYTRSGVRRSLEGSLERLGVEKLTIAFVHDIGRVEHGAEYEAQLRRVLDEALPELDAARHEGLIDFIGIGVNEWRPLVEILERAPLDCALLAGRYTLIEQTAGEALDICAAKDVRIIAGGVFNSGLLSSRPNAESTYNYAPAPAGIVVRAQALWDACERLSVTPQAAALQFPLRHRTIASVVAGARSNEEATQLAAWRDEAIPESFWETLTRDGLIGAAWRTEPCG
jgi:D-threo-aldose 1-dehydrogenase